MSEASLVPILTLMAYVSKPSSCLKAFNTSLSSTSTPVKGILSTQSPVCPFDTCLSVLCIWVLLALEPTVIVPNSVSICSLARHPPYVVAFSAVFRVPPEVMTGRKRLRANIMYLRWRELPYAKVALILRPEYSSFCAPQLLNARSADPRGYTEEIVSLRSVVPVISVRTAFPCPEYLNGDALLTEWIFVVLASVFYRPSDVMIKQQALESLISQLLSRCVTAAQSALLL